MDFLVFTLLSTLISHSMGFKINDYCNGINYRNITIERIPFFYRSGQLSAVILTQCYLGRIDQYNPFLNAVIEVNPDALEIASKLDYSFINDHKTTGSLHGIPVLIQDNFSTHDEMETTSGSERLIGIKPKKDAIIVSKLRQAGAIILGKTNLSELSGTRFGREHQGYSERGGQIKNPFNKSEKIPGTSSGAAVAVAFNFAIATFGTSIEGSISGPASTLGIYGFSPSFDILSNKGIIMCPFIDKVGIFSKSIQDTLIILKEISEKPNIIANFFDDANYNKVTFENINLGIVKNMFYNEKVTNYQLSHYKMIFRLFRLLDSKNMWIDLPINADNMYLASSRQLIGFHLRINNYLKKEVIHTMLAKPIYNLSHIIKYNGASNNVQPYNDSLLKAAISLDAVKNRIYKNFYKYKMSLYKDLNNFLAKEDIYAIAVPSHYELRSYEIPSLLKLPEITIPISDAKKERFGITLYGLPGSDDILLDMALNLVNRF